LSDSVLNPKSPRWTEAQRQALWAWAFILPCLLGLIVFTYLPILASFGLSFSYWNLLGEPQWVGLANYQAVIQDPIFWTTFWNTWGFVLASGVLEVVLGLLLAVWIFQLLRGQAWFRSLYFMPYITPMVSITLVFGWIYDPQFGLLNAAIQTVDVFGLMKEPVAWLQDPKTAMASVVMLRVWKNVGYNVLLFLAALGNLPSDLEESAHLDGASSWQIFWRITLPLISPTLFFVLVMTMINAFQVFDSIYLLTQGGPQHATEVLVYWMFKNAFEFYKIGPASAIAYILFWVILALTALQWQIRKRWVLHE
jgi:multiple sugar transport system permease protein